MWTDVSEARITSILKAENQPSKKPECSRRLPKWRWYVPPKRRFTYELHGVISQKMAIFITAVVRTSNSTLFPLFWWNMFRNVGNHAADYIVPQSGELKPELSLPWKLNVSYMQDIDETWYERYKYLNNLGKKCCNITLFCDYVRKSPGFSLQKCLLVAHNYIHVLISAVLYIKM
jgi:hypothetical protein